MALASFRWIVVSALATADEALDQLVYRPAVVKLFSWLPRWWLCDLAQASMALDNRWKLGYWAAAGIAPSGVCEACGGRAAIHVVRGSVSDSDADAISSERVWFLDERPVYLCGWCSIRTPIQDQTDLNAALAEARARSIAWRW
jgi:hypothetical protein